MEERVAIQKIDELKRRIRDALGSDLFQGAAAGLSGNSLSKAVAGVFEKNNIRVSLISVSAAAPAALADFAAVWRTSLGGKSETSWFSLKKSPRR
jgi:hypothetical protein